MQVAETLAEGLKRELKISIPAADLDGRLAERLEDLKDKVRLNGFRPGKVPVSHLRKVYGKSAMAEIVQELLNETSRNLLDERKERAAMQPKFDMTEDEAEANKILDGKADLEFTMAYEILPEMPVGDLSAIKIDRPVAEISDADVEEELNKLADNARPFEMKKGKAKDGDRVNFSYLGKIDGEPFEGGADEDSNLVLGSGRFIPGFEEQLQGVKAGDEKVITVTFPEDYGAANLAGKEATFDIEVKEVAAPGDVELNDELAKTFGAESLDNLKEMVKTNLEGQYGARTRQKIKRQLLDQLDEMHKFDLPPTLVEQEFNNVWQQVEQDMKQSGQTFDDGDQTEEEAKAEYQTIAERRVRLGLLMQEIGTGASIEVTEQEMQGALMQRLRQFPGQEQEVFDFYRNNPEAMASIRAPVYEEKVVDHILTSATITDQTVSKEELMADDEEEA